MEAGWLHQLPGQKTHLSPCLAVPISTIRIVIAPTSWGGECVGFCKAPRAVPGVVGLHAPGPSSSPSRFVGWDVVTDRRDGSGEEKGPVLLSPLSAEETSSRSPSGLSSIGQNRLTHPPGPITGQGTCEAGWWALDPRTSNLAGGRPPSPPHGSADTLPAHFLFCKGIF